MLQVIVTDSAGLRRTDCPIEAEGVRRAVAAAQQAQLVLHVSDVAAGSAGNRQDDDAEEDAPELPLSPHAVHMRVLNKADLLDSAGAADCLQSAAAAAAARSAAAVPAPATLLSDLQRAGSVERWDAPAQASATGSAAAALTMQESAGPQPASHAAHVEQQDSLPATASAHIISCQTGEGIDLLMGALEQQVLALVGQSGDAGFSGALVTRTRHRCMS